MNRRNLSAVLAFALLLDAVPAAATTLDTFSVRPSEALGVYGKDGLKVASNLEKIVCRYEPPPTGTRIGGWRECESQRYWNGLPHHVRTWLLYSTQ